MMYRKAAAYGVHLLTASGVAFMFLAAVEIGRVETRAWLVFVYFLGATVVDAIDGPLARLAGTKVHAAKVSGRTIDDIVDYLGFTFLPLLLVWDMGWLPGHREEAHDVTAWASGVLIVAAMMTSLLGFAHAHAKDEERGFFRGFPSYWNLVVIYLGLSAAVLGEVGLWINAAVVGGLAVLTVLPVWLVYPNLAPGRWKAWVLVGSYVWAAGLLAMLPWYPDEVPGWAVAVSLIYPAFYVWLSWHLRARWPRAEREEASSREPLG